MDEIGATHICEMLKASDGGARSQSLLPTYLIVLSGAMPGAMLPLAAGATRLGRASDNDLQLPDQSVSRYHAQLRLEDDGLARLSDQGSTNGTFLNGERLSSHIPFMLRDGDRIRFGSSMTVKFVRPDPCEERFQREMFERAIRDPLTSLYNRNYFLERVRSLSAQDRRKGLGLAVLMLDIDHFKRVNDTHGHCVGDSVLRDVAAVLRHSTRTEDLVARYGGEEFVAALPIASSEQAEDRAERVRADLASRRIIVGKEPIRITASIGLAFAPANHPRPIEALIAAADLCLYQAKGAGRDRVVFDRAQTLVASDLQITMDGEMDFIRQERPIGL